MPKEAVPQRTRKQRYDALEKANRVRTDRAVLKRKMKARKISVLELILDPPQLILTMKVEDLLLATPKYGKVKTQKVLQLTRISPSKTVGGLSARQRTELVWRMNGGSGNHH